MTIASEPVEKEITPAQREMISYALKRLRDDSHSLLQAINERPAPVDPPAASPSAAPAPSPPE